MICFSPNRLRCICRLLVVDGFPLKNAEIFASAGQSDSSASDRFDKLS